MKTIFLTVFLGLAALMLTACATPAKDTTSNTNGNKTKPAPTAGALFALDQQANEAYFKSDAKFFERVLSDKFVMHEDGQRMDKAAVLKMIAANKCDIKDWKLDEPQLSKIDADTYVLAYKGMIDGSCTGPDGMSLKLPSPTRAATVWLRNGENWLAAYHGENAIIDPQNPPPAKAGGKREAQKKDNKAATDSSTSKRPAADPTLTHALMAVEQAAWKAWMEKDGKKIEDLTTSDLSFQNIFGTHFANKADALKDWTGSACDVTSVNVADGAASLLSPSIGILTSKGTAVGSCGGQKPAKIRVYGTSVYVKDGDSWKLAFGLNRPFD